MPPLKFGAGGACFIPVDRWGLQIERIENNDFGKVGVDAGPWELLLAKKPMPRGLFCVSHLGLRFWAKGVLCSRGQLADVRKGSALLASAIDCACGCVPLFDRKRKPSEIRSGQREVPGRNPRQPF